MSKKIKDLGKVAVLMGGHSAEREISLRSGAAVLSALQQAGVNAHAFDPAEQSLISLVEQKFDRCFVILHGRGGEDGTIQGALTCLNLPFTGSDVLSSALAMDKVKCKQIWQALHLPTAPYHVVSQADVNAVSCEHILKDLQHDVFVKPHREGSSVGMARAKDTQTLLQALKGALKYDPTILVEQSLQGAEYTVGLIGDQTLPSIRLSTPRDFYDFEAKYQSNSTSYDCPSGLSASQEQEIQQLAKAYDAIDVKDGLASILCKTVMVVSFFRN